MGSKYFNASKVFFYNLKLLGLAPYNFDAKTREISVNFVNYLGLFAYIFIWIAIIVFQVFTWPAELTITDVRSTILDRLWQYQYFIQHGLTIVIILFNFVKRKSVENYLQLLERFDRMVEELGWKHKAKAISTSSAATFFVISVLFFITYMSLSWFLIANNIIYILIFIFILDFFLMLAMEFILSTYFIYTRLNAMLSSVR